MSVRLALPSAKKSTTANPGVPPSPKPPAGNTPIGDVFEAAPLMTVGGEPGRYCRLWS